MSFKQVSTLLELGLKLSEAAASPALMGVAHGADGIIVQETDLRSAFYDLKSGLLGELFQKLSTHRLPTAFVVAGAALYGERFTGLAREPTRYPLIRFFSTPEQGHLWLEALP